jgi:hypothetical protein
MRVLRPASFDEYVRWYLSREKRKEGQADDHRGRSSDSLLAEMLEFHPGKLRPWFGGARWRIIMLETLSDAMHLVFLDSYEMRLVGLLSAAAPDARLGGSFVAAARNAGYFEERAGGRINPLDGQAHRQRAAQFRCSWPDLRNAERLALCSLNPAEKAENPGGTYYVNDGLGRLLPYLYLVVHEGYPFHPIEAILAEEVSEPPGPPRFFDMYNRFYQTTTVGANPARLNARFRAIMQTNAHCIAGSTVLDIASHDGRWSFAALKTGARHVLGVEPDFQLTQAAAETFGIYNVPASAFTFANADVYDLLPGLPVHSIDTVLCLGFLYHTMNHQLLFSLIAALRPRHLIVDTCISPSPDAIITLRPEKMAAGLGVSAWHGPVARKCIVGTPSRRALEMMLADAGFRTHAIDWTSMQIEDWTGIEDYRDGTRVTLRADFHG